MKQKDIYICPMAELVEIESEGVMADSIGISQDKVGGVARSKEREFWME